MKTVSYNPSPIEVQLAKSIAAVKERLAEHMNGMKIEKIKEELETDNPILRFYLVDEDDDKHEVVVQIIQKPDTL